MKKLELIKTLQELEDQKKENSFMDKLPFFRFVNPQDLNKFISYLEKCKKTDKKITEEISIKKRRENTSIKAYNKMPVRKI
jgi:hypothetical protein